MKRCVGQYGSISPRLRVVVTGTFATAAVACVGYGAHRRHVQRRQEEMSGGSTRAVRMLPPTLVEAVAGAVGEIIQVVVLYPLDTIKVRCQANSLTTSEVVRELLQSCRKPGQLLGVLYAGALGAALCSVLVGAVHYASYESCKRYLLQQQTALKQQQQQQQRQQQAQVSSTKDKHSREASHAAASISASSGGCEHGSHDSNVGHYPLHNHQQQQQQGAHASLLSQHQHSQGNAMLAARATEAQHGGEASTGTSGSEAAPHVTHQQQTDSKLWANITAAMFTAFATALVESPVELFRHNQQAGLVKGSFMREMVQVVRREGPSGLYWGFLPHCFEAWPHDVSEMLVMGSMKDAHENSPAVRQVPVQVWDLVTGAASGAAAVLVSMPFDSVKTYMQTHGTDLTGKGLLGSARLFLRTGQKLVARKGVGSLYYGVAPRLLQQVPSAMIGWWAVHSVARSLEPWTCK